MTDVLGDLRAALEDIHCRKADDGRVTYYYPGSRETMEALDRFAAKHPGLVDLSEWCPANNHGLCESYEEGAPDYDCELPCPVLAQRKETM